MTVKTFTVTETQVFELKAEGEDQAEALVRDGVSHSKELLDATVQFFVSERDVEEKSV